MQRFCLTVKLKASPDLIEQYRVHHRAVWPAVLASLHEAGVLDMQIYLHDNRLFLVMETDDAFTLEKKAALDRANPKVREWEELMEQFQDPGEGGDRFRKWEQLEQVFSLAEANRAAAAGA